ncbi:MAG TPA: class I SAM-dependent methyltransferase [Anaerolineaceae bacterium]|nr:class I SAM-dependent methyltransferase [Anaerolineaceae bacterium]
MTNKDHLWLQLKSMPYFRGLLRAVEARFYDDIQLDGPVLDLGCGDGHFASVVFDQPLAVGLDPWPAPLREAAEKGVYQLPVQAAGARTPFPDQCFGSAISNSVLEHIPEIDPVLAEIARVLKPGALFVFCVPNHNFDAHLSLAGFCDRIGLRKLATGYRRFFDRIARHHHLDSPEIWTDRLIRAGFTVERWWHYFSPDALAVLEWGHAFSLPALVARKLFGRWIIAPTRWNLVITDAITRPFFEEPSPQPEGVCTFYITRRCSED